MSPTSLLERHARAGMAAACEALFPENDYGAPSFRDTDLVPRLLEYLAALPKDQRRLLLLLFAFVELASVVLIGGFRRFSRHTPARREAAVRAFRRSRFLPLRIVGDGLKAATTIIYMSHPAALAYVGAYAVCDRPADPLQLPVRKGALAPEAAE